MIRINSRKILLHLFCAGCLGLVFVPPLPAADCDAVLGRLSGLTGLMQRQQLLLQGIKECPDDYRINYAYAYNLERLRKYQEALSYYEAAVRLKPDFAKSYVGMGDVYLVMGQGKAAVDALHKGLSLDPDNVWAQRSYRKALQLDKGGVAPPAGAESGSAGEMARRPPVPGTNAEPANEIQQTVAVRQPAAAREGVTAITAEDFVRSMTRTDQGSVLSMQIQFDISSGNLTGEAKEKLDSVVCQALQSMELRESRFEVAGHTDDRGAPEHNMYLSRIRAQQVRDYLVTSCGINPDRLTVVYYGQERPAFPNTTRQNRMLNRRVEFRRLP
ncbi:MAG: OmpA family protein [Deltaproteobacteria bacterium]|nr:OmpA family protein [Deltaproteobacteria bacterium]